MARYVIACEIEIDSENVLQADEMRAVVWDRIIMALSILGVRWNSAEMKITLLE